MLEETKTNQIIEMKPKRTNITTRSVTLNSKETPQKPRRSATDNNNSTKVCFLNYLNLNK